MAKDPGHAQVAAAQCQDGPRVFFAVEAVLSPERRVLRTQHSTAIHFAPVNRNDTLIANFRVQLQTSAPFRTLKERLDGHRVEVTGASYEARALLLATLQETTKKGIAVIVPGDAAIDDFHTALHLFAAAPRRVSSYPSPALSPYQDVGPSLGVTREEIRALGMLTG